eukprot:6201277-Pleurochrysis_carterae.AAC.2
MTQQARNWSIYAVSVDVVAAAEDTRRLWGDTGPSQFEWPQAALSRTCDEVSPECRAIAACGGGWGPAPGRTGAPCSAPRGWRARCPRTPRAQGGSCWRSAHGVRPSDAAWGDE